MFRLVLFSLFFVKLASAQSLLEQQDSYTLADTLRGSLRPERTCFDVTFYELNVRLDTANQSISGSNKIVFRAVRDFTRMQIDLYANMNIDSIVSGGQKAKYKREFNAVFIDLPGAVDKGD